MRYTVIAYEPTYGGVVSFNREAEDPHAAMLAAAIGCWETDDGDLEIMGAVDSDGAFTAPCEDSWKSASVGTLYRNGAQVHWMENGAERQCSLAEFEELNGDDWAIREPMERGESVTVEEIAYWMPCWAPKPAPVECDIPY